MEISTKFSLGDYVYPIGRGGHEAFVKCPTCDGEKLVKIEGKEMEISCPSCFGKGGSREYIVDKWYVHKAAFGYIGKVNVELYQPNDKDNKSEVSYMLSSTGIGSGTCWREEWLFDNPILAQEECDKRNQLKEE